MVNMCLSFVEKVRELLHQNYFSIVTEYHIAGVHFVFWIEVKSSVEFQAVKLF
jgi:hypothetical protein